MFVIAQEQFYIMKPKEVVTRSFKLYPTTDQAARYACSGIVVYLFEQFLNLMLYIFYFLDPYNETL